MKRDMLKQRCRLVQNIVNLSGGEARLNEDIETDDATVVYVILEPRLGPYRGGQFKFELYMGYDYPTKPPLVTCQTHIYHPNIQSSTKHNGKVCLNTFAEDWEPTMTLENVVLDLLHLLNNPNLEDPISPLIDATDMNTETFKRRVRRSLYGKTVKGIHFDRNLVDTYEPSEEEERVDEDDAAFVTQHLVENNAEVHCGQVEVERVDENGVNDATLVTQQLQHLFENAKVCCGEVKVKQGKCPTTVLVTLKPHIGSYRGGQFKFRIEMSDNYPNKFPLITCLTRIYHPNIENESGEVYLDLVDNDWEPTTTLEDVVLGMLNLLYYPNLENPLSDLFINMRTTDDEETFKRLVRQSLHGKMVKGIHFDRNLVDGYESEEEERVDDKGINDQQQQHLVENKADVSDGHAMVNSPTIINVSQKTSSGPYPTKHTIDGSESEEEEEKGEMTTETSDRTATP